MSVSDLGNETVAEEIGSQPSPPLPTGASECSRFWVVWGAKPALLSGVWGGLAKSEFFVLRRETRAARYLAVGSWHEAVAEWRSFAGRTTAVPVFRRTDQQGWAAAER